MNAPNPDTAESKTIEFSNGNKGQIAIVPGAADPLKVLEHLGIKTPRAVMVIAGGAGNMSQGQLRRLMPFFSLGIARAAKKLNAMIIDGGTQSGVMELMGNGVADHGSTVDLVGVAPSGKVIFPGSTNPGNAQDLAPLDPNHTHFVLVQSENWGDETAMMYSLAETLHLGKFTKTENDAGAEKKLPAVTILAGGRIRGIALKEALTTVRKGWPLVVMEGSGQLQDEIAIRFRNHRSKSKIGRAFGRLGETIRRSFSPDIQEADSSLNEIVEEGDIVLFSKTGKPSDLEKLLLNQLKAEPADSILIRAWKRFAVYDANATRHQKTYRILKSWALILGVLATALILGQEFLINNKIIQIRDVWYEVLRVLIVLVPAVISVFLAADRLLKSGNKWLLLRYYAEEIKKDIYSYRALSSLKYHPHTDLPDEATDLSTRITTIGQRLMRTEVNESALRPYAGPIPPAMYGAAAKDDGLSPLDTESYINIRINDQVSFYTLKTNKLERQLQPGQWLILVFGAVGSLLAALGGLFQFWVPLTVAIVSALTAYLEYQQVEQTIVKYNQAMTKLNNLADEWVAIEQKKAPKNIVWLVENTERILQSEHLGWVQQMQTAQEETGKTEAAVSTVESDTDQQPKGEKKKEKPSQRDVTDDTILSADP